MSDRPGGGGPVITGASRVGFHELRRRLDRGTWIIGRVDAGDFVEVPAIAVEVIDLLEAGRSVDEAGAELRSVRGRDIDVVGFASSLTDLGFVAEVDGEPVPGPPPLRSTLPRVQARHVGWLVGAPVRIGWSALVAAAAVVAVARPSALPEPHDLLWSRWGGIVLAGNAAASWTVVLLHELGHLLTARAYGVPGRLTLGTRLQYLAAQTEVTGVWACRRSERITVYLAGIAVNVMIVAVAVLAGATAVPGSTAARACSAVGVLSLVMIPPQFLIFVRSDIYFVLQDLTGCRNLYADGGRYVRWLVARPLRRRAAVPDPTLDLPHRERVAIRWYAVLLVAGTAVWLGVAVGVTVPFTVRLLARTASPIGSGTALARLDAGCTVATLSAFWALWARAWWRRHGVRVLALARRPGAVIGPDP